MVKNAFSPVPKRSQWKTPPRWLDVSRSVNIVQLLTALKIFSISGAYLLTLSAESNHFNFVVILLLLFGVIGIARWTDQRYGETPPAPAVYLWIAVTFVLIQTITILSDGTLARLLLVLPSVIAVFHLRQRAALGVSMASIVWIVVTAQLFPLEQNNESIQPLILLIIIYLSGHALAYTLLQERRARQQAQQLLSELAESNEQLTRYAAEVNQLATIRERNRIAREIHDSLGHYLTIVGVQLEKAILLDSAAPDESGKALNAAKQLTDQALREVRQSVETLRETDQAFTLQTALQSLVANAQHADLKVDLRWRGDESGFSKPQLMTLFRATQEGLTNVQKHAQASRVSIDVALDAELAVLRLEDNGIGFDPTSIESGRYGLQGLRERVELLDGTLTLEPSSTGGARIVVRLQKKELI